MNIRSNIFGSGNSASEEPLLKGKQPKGAKPDELQSISVAREETRRADTRDQDRHRLPDEQIRVSHKGKSHSVQLINLSGGGAMIEGEFTPKLWDRVELHLGDEGGIECAVCWLKGSRVGLEFAHETGLDCSLDQQAAVLREVIARNFPDVEFEAGMQAEATISTEGEEHRGERRHPLIWSGMLHYDFDSTPVRLRNISSSGAQIECESPPPVGAEPLLDLGGAGSTFGTVSWVAGDHAGLRFKEPFDLSHLSRARPELAPIQWERPAYLKPGAAADSPWAKEWDRMSLGELRDQLEGFIKR